jgi:hypothetical protein
VKLKEIRKLIEAATPGDWSPENFGPFLDDGELEAFCAFGPQHDLDEDGETEQAEAKAKADAAFIAASRTLMPKLLAVAEAAEGWRRLNLTSEPNRAIDAALAALEADE